MNCSIVSIENQLSLYRKQQKETFKKRNQKRFTDELIVYDKYINQEEQEYLTVLELQDIYLFEYKIWGYTLRKKQKEKDKFNATLILVVRLGLKTIIKTLLRYNCIQSHQRNIFIIETDEMFISKLVSKMIIHINNKQDIFECIKLLELCPAIKIDYNKIIQKWFSLDLPQRNKKVSLIKQVVKNNMLNSNNDKINWLYNRASLQ